MGSDERKTGFAAAAHALAGPELFPCRLRVLGSQNRPRAGVGDGNSGDERPHPAESRGAPRQVPPLTLGAWKAARAPGSAPAPGGLTVREEPPQCRRLRARRCPDTLRQRWELPGYGPARRCLVPHGWSSSVPLLLPGRDPHERPQPRSRLTHARGFRAVLPRRRSLRAAFPAPFSFASRPLPAPPAPQPGRSSGPARVPRGFRREDEAVFPLMPSWEAAEPHLLPSAPLRVPAGL